MQPLSSFLRPLPSSPGLLSKDFRTSDASQAKAITKTHTDLTVVTAGGDRITLSTESLLRASYTGLDSQSSDSQRNVSLHATASEVQRSNSISVSVQGQLDPQEEADLQRLVGTLDKVVNQFVGGDAEGALGQVLNIGDLGTVASFDLHFQESDQIATTQKQSVSTQEPRAIQPQKVGTEGEPNTPSLLTQLVDSIKDANLDLNKLLKRLPEVLKQVFEKIEPNVSDNSLAHLFSAVETLLKPTIQLPDSTSPSLNIPA